MLGTSGVGRVSTLLGELPSEERRAPWQSDVADRTMRKGVDLGWVVGRAGSL